jgi:phage terminase large subunit-like protein
MSGIPSSKSYALQVQRGNVGLLAGDWVQAFWDECETWPKGKFNDQVDAAAGRNEVLAAPFGAPSHSLPKAQICADIG